MKTVMRNVRISADLDAILHAEAAANNQTVSALLMSILTKYAEFDRFAQKFGFVTVPRSNYARTLDAMDEETYMKASSQATSTFIEMVRFWHNRADAEAICEFAEKLGKYAGTTQCRVHRSSGEYTVIFQHELGPKFSHIIKRTYEGAIRTVVGNEPKIETTDNSVLIKFRGETSKQAAPTPDYP